MLLFQKLVDNLRGRWRLWWRLCPYCNCDGPACDVCLVCNGHRVRASGQRLEDWRRTWMSNEAAIEIINLGQRLTIRDARQMGEYLTNLAEHEASRESAN